jgi:hypothetical protein
MIGGSVGSGHGLMHFYIFPGSRMNLPHFIVNTCPSFLDFLSPLHPESMIQANAVDIVRVVVCVLNMRDLVVQMKGFIPSVSGREIIKRNVYVNGVGNMYEAKMRKNKNAKEYEKNEELRVSDRNRCCRRRSFYPLPTLSRYSSRHLFESERKKFSRSTVFQIGLIVG